MTVSISFFHGAERIRDGGSLVAEFQCGDGCLYSLMLPIKVFGVEPDEFKAPVLINRTADLELDIPVTDALATLHQLLGMVQSKKEKAILERMIRIVKD